MKNTYSVQNELTNRIKSFGEHIKNIVKDKNIKYLIPLETKGALLVDTACGTDALPESLKIIYPRALRYIQPSDVSSSQILLVDDIYFSGRHLKNVYESIKSYGAKAENIHCLAFLDFSSGERDKDYEGDIHDRVCENILPGAPLRRSETLLFLQKEMLEKTMPSVYDHLTIEAQNVQKDTYIDLLARLSKINRLLHYGQRGAYQTSSILLDDLFDGKWDVPPKARIWWHSIDKALRITPVGCVTGRYVSDKICFSKDLQKAIVDTVISGSTSDSKEAIYESSVLSGRIQQLILLKRILYDLKLKFNFKNEHLDRYYPGLQITDKINNILRRADMLEMPARSKVYEDQGYGSAIMDILKLNKDAWTSQPSTLRKDRVNKGLTASEIFDRLRNYNEIQLHAALDYCFDYHYLAVFRESNETGFSRCYRTTEISGDLLHEEVLGAAVIYSLKTPTPDWLLNKIFPIIRSITPGLIYDGHLAITKAYFGDVTRIKKSEDSYCSWKDVQTDLWDIDSSGAGVCYMKKNDELTKEKVQKIMDDPRLAGFRDTMAAVIFLLENGGRDAAILLDILTPGYGGADYIAYNISKILSYGSNYQTEDTQYHIEWHSKGADEKLRILLDLFDNQDNLLNKLMRRSTRLQNYYLIQAQAEKAIRKARPFTSKILYDALKILKSGISDAVIAAKQNYIHGFETALNSMGMGHIERNKNLKYLLSRVAQNIYPTLYAISGQTFPWQYYEKHLIGPKDDLKYILGYDLTGERRKVIPDGEELTRFDDEMHKFFANWIIAFNGKLSTSGMNAGDLRFGFFRTLDEAINAGCWTMHHLDQLKQTNCFPLGPESLGVVITQGGFKVDAIGNASGQVLDMSGHWLKGKIIERENIDAAAGKVGRKGTEFQDSQLWIIEHETFEIDRTKRYTLDVPKKLKYKNNYINLSAIDIAKFVEMKITPWINRG